MGVARLLQNQFQGMYQDLPQDSLPPGKLWSCTNFIPEYIGAPLTRRGPWTVQSPQFGSCADVLGIISVDTGSGTASNYVVGDDLHFYSYALHPPSQSDLGTAFAIAQNPILHRTGTTPLVVIPAASGSTTAKSYDGSTFQNLAGSPPQGKYADVWNDRTLLANATANPQRLWFSPVGNAAGTWDTTNAWQDTRLPILGIAAIRTGILLFHTNTTDLITGTTPPSATTIGDLNLRAPVFNVGCIDARSIVKYNDTVIWADGRGVYQSDGNTVKDLTVAGGMQSAWQALISQLPKPNTITTASNPIIAAGVFHDTYIVSITYQQVGVRFELATLAYDLSRGYWYGLSNFNARAYARQAATSVEETLMSVYGSGFLGGVSGILSGAGSTDGNSVDIIPSLTTGFYRGLQRIHNRWASSFSLQSWRRFYVTYLQGGSAGPRVTITVTTNQTGTPEALSPSLPIASSYARAHRDVFRQSSGVAFTISQSQASDTLKIDSLEIEYSPLESSRLAQ